MQSADPTLKNNEIPKEFFCSLTQKLLLNPVTEKKKLILFENFNIFSKIPPLIKNFLIKKFFAFFVTVSKSRLLQSIE